MTRLVVTINDLTAAQHTANLIAYYSTIHQNPYIRDMIEKRLGLS